MHDEKDVTTMKTYTSHPCADILEMQSEDEYSALKESISKFGQRVPIVVNDDVLIDGRNRLRACQELGIEPEIVAFSDVSNGATEAEFIDDMNLTRRNITKDQRIQARAKLYSHPSHIEAVEARKKAALAANSSKGGKASKGPKSTVAQKPEPRLNRDYKTKNANSTAGLIAAKEGCSRYEAEQALKLEKEDPEAAEKVRKGEITSKEARKMTKEREMTGLEITLPPTVDEALSVPSKVLPKESVVERKKLEKYRPKKETTKDERQWLINQNGAVRNAIITLRMLCRNLEDRRAFLEWVKNFT